ncbi:hypothetical protein EB796_022102 [Bugula neritina]|uniref:Uncharacterized protein n=1 Tax=Bugula neritina TaxID=10212 RepID=A0A7J7J1G7_BUGNE|nr:hypothetical protein EB796_022102 [Bugula neritina]
MVSPLLSDLPNLLDTVTWTSDNSNTLSSKSNQTLIRLSSQLDDINAQVAKLSKLREAVESVSKSYGK